MRELRRRFTADAIFKIAVDLPQSWKTRRGFISSHKALMISSYLLAGYPKDETDRKFINDEA